MKIEAGNRLKAMSITKGDNYEEGQSVADSLLNSKCSEWKILKTGSQVVAQRTEDKTVSFAYMTGVGLKTLPKSGTLKEAGITSVDAFIRILLRGESISTVWVSSKMRSKGYGKSLYELAHSHSKRGLTSSQDLGTMSLALWLSLYRKYPSIKIRIGGIRAVDRSRVHIKDLHIEVDGEDAALTDPDGPDFTFWWPK